MLNVHNSYCLTMLCRKLCGKHDFHRQPLKIKIKHSSEWFLIHCIFYLTNPENLVMMMWSFNLWWLPKNQFYHTFYHDLLKLLQQTKNKLYCSLMINQMHKTHSTRTKILATNYRKPSWLNQIIKFWQWCTNKKHIKFSAIRILLNTFCWYQQSKTRTIDRLPHLTSPRYDYWHNIKFAANLIKLCWFQEKEHNLQFFNAVFCIICIFLFPAYD